MSSGEHNPLCPSNQLRMPLVDQEKDEELIGGLRGGNDLVILNEKELSEIERNIGSPVRAGLETPECEISLCIDNVEVVRDIGYSQR